MDRLEWELRDSFLVIRISVISDLGKDLRSRYQTGVVPTFIVFNNVGKEVWRHSGSVPELEEILILGL